jgi:hypothetical protein
MSDKKTNRKNLAAQKMHAALLAVLGSANIKVLGIILLYAIALNLFFEAVNTLIGLLDGESLQYGKFSVGLGSFLILTLWFAVVIRNKEGSISPTVKALTWRPGQQAASVYKTPQKTQALIVFLSPPIRDEELVESILSGEKKLDLNLQQDRERFRGPWRMIIEAVNYHLPELVHLVIIPSTETRQEFIKLKKCIELLCPAKQIEIIVGKGCDNGLDFEDVRELVEALDKIYQSLKTESGYNAQAILIDITGGQKVSTIAGAIVSLSEGRSFQYVSTKNYSINTYDVTYQVA